jgi:tetratricopeptide (TPR) repeat protein
MGKGPVLLIILFLGLGVAIWLAPHSPKNILEETESHSHGEFATPEEKVEAAVALIRDAQGAPMQGIQMLREVVEEHPEYLIAHYFLGEFSVMSGQYDKAIERFETALSIDAEHLPSLRYLAIAFTENGQSDKALTLLDSFMETFPENDSMDEIRELRNFIAAEMAKSSVE